MWLQTAPIFTGGVEREVPHLIAQAGWVAKGILLLLAGLSIVSWAIIFQKLRAFAAARRSYREGEPLVRAINGLPDVPMVHVRLRGSPWSKLLGAAYAETYGENIPGEDFPLSGGHADAEDLVDRVGRAMDRAASDERDRFEHGILILGTVANVSPFLGLFGTVWGIMNSFLSIGLKGAANLAAVGPGIAEALIVTAAGLAAAIPAAIAYNNFLGRLRRLESDLERLSGLILDKVRYGTRTASEAKRIPYSL